MNRKVLSYRLQLIRTSCYILFANPSRIAFCLSGLKEYLQSTWQVLPTLGSSLLNSQNQCWQLCWTADNIWGRKCTKPVSTKWGVQFPSNKPRYSPSAAFSRSKLTTQMEDKENWIFIHIYLYRVLNGILKHTSYTNSKWCDPLGAKSEISSGVP